MVLNEETSNISQGQKQLLTIARAILADNKILILDCLLYTSRLKETYSFSYWERVDECHSAVRFCTSWATREEDIETFAKDLTQLGRG